MRRLGWWVGLGSVWGVAFGCAERELPLGEGPAKGGEFNQGGGSGGAVTLCGLSAMSCSGTGGVAGSGQGGFDSQGGVGNAASGGGGPGGGAGPQGDGGACNDAPGPELDVSSCAVSPFTMGVSTCSEADTRRILACGQPGSTLDANCCPRTVCRDDSDCGANAACVPRLVQQSTFGGSLVEGCEMYCGECSCWITADIDSRGYCVQRDEELERFVCDLVGASPAARSCAELRQWRENISEFSSLSVEDRTATGLTSYAARSIACAGRLERELGDRCGSAPQCECTDRDCTVPVSQFHPFSAFLGIGRLSLDGMSAAPLLCNERDLDFGRYSECDDGSVRYHLSEGSKNEYLLVFDPRNRLLTYGSADGYVAEACLPGELDTATLSTGPAPAPTACRSCEFCANEPASGAGGAGGDSLPDCVFAPGGFISLPRP